MNSVNSLEEGGADLRWSKLRFKIFRRSFNSREISVDQTWNPSSKLSMRSSIFAVRDRGAALRIISSFLHSAKIVWFLATAKETIGDVKYWLLGQKCGSLWLFRSLMICNYSKAFKFLRTFVAFAGDTLKECQNDSSLLDISLFCLHSFIILWFFLSLICISNRSALVHF